ncbi:response regulator [Candidatus Ferrigenium straubiae]|jgi:DNA-binding NarL/FixJ family response regulator|uniref:response regulator n=1 Tax=Candidatus Ferrigenium straubiae TaxID=2919506 RepID=UPI003F4AE0FA
MNVFIVEDAAIMLKNLRSILSDIPGVTVIGQAAGVAEAIERIGTLLPDFVILDISLRNGTGISMLECIKKRHPGIKVVVLTGCTDEFYSDRCKRAGADYFFDKAFQLTRVRAALWQWVYPGRRDGGLEALPMPGC